MTTPTPIPETRLVRPIRPELIVMTPAGARLPAPGLLVPWDSYWRRRLRDGSIEIVEAVEPATTRRGRGNMLPPSVAANDEQSGA